jgi:hypothetical protein
MDAADYDKLIDSAADEPLGSVLPKVIRLAQSASDDQRAEWARMELLGYLGTNPAMTETTVVPEYRAVGGAWFDAYGRRLMVEPGLAFVNSTRVREGGRIGKHGEQARAHRVSDAGVF